MTDHLGCEIHSKILTEVNYLDEMLFAFMVPLLPHILENRLGLDATLTQRYTSVFLVEGALISIVSSPLIGDIADRASSKKALLLVLLVLTLISVLSLSMTTSCKYIPVFPILKRYIKASSDFYSNLTICRSLLPMHREQCLIYCGNSNHGREHRIRTHG